MIFSGNIRSNNVYITFTGDKIEVVKEFRYLGVLFAQNGRFIHYFKNFLNWQETLCTC